MRLNETKQVGNGRGSKTAKVLQSVEDFLLNEVLISHYQKTQKEPIELRKAFLPLISPETSEDPSSSVLFPPKISNKNHGENLFVENVFQKSRTMPKNQKRALWA